MNKYKIEKSSTVACLALNKLGISAPYHKFFSLWSIKSVENVKMYNHNT